MAWCLYRLLGQICKKGLKRGQISTKMVQTTTKRGQTTTKRGQTTTKRVKPTLKGVKPPLKGSKRVFFDHFLTASKAYYRVLTVKSALKAPFFAHAFGPRLV